MVRPLWVYLELYPLVNLTSVKISKSFGGFEIFSYLCITNKKVRRYGEESKANL